VSSSFWNIAKELEISAREILSVSDILAELDAAATAGFQTALSIRPGNADITREHPHQTINNFEELQIKAIQNKDAGA
jgi:enolase-phosphatase E1